jgi:hypothetical protein
MTMLDANTPAFRQQYPNGATVYDRTGRRIGNVFACNPETGEVIAFDSSRLTRAWIRLVNLLPLQQWWKEASICTRHGFWPAPLTIRSHWRRTPPAPDFWDAYSRPVSLPSERCILIPLKPATEADLAFTINEPLPEVAWRSLVTGESVTTEGFIDPYRPPLPVLDDRTPEEICGYGDDGLCSH